MVSFMFPALGRIIWSLAICFMVVAGSTEFSEGKWLNSRDKQPNDKFTFRRIHCQDLKLEAAAAVQSNVVFCLSVQSARGHFFGDVKRDALPSRLLLDAGVCARLLSHHLPCRLLLHADLRESHHHVREGIHKVMKF
jgi:hypothetical protein